MIDGGQRACVSRLAIAEASSADRSEERIQWRAKTLLETPLGIESSASETATRSWGET
jgi:hypothetical protein